MTELKLDDTAVTTMQDKPVSKIFEKTDDNDDGIEFHNVKFSKPEYGIYNATHSDNPQFPPYIRNLTGSNTSMSVGGRPDGRVIVTGFDDILKIKSINGVRTKFTYHDEYYHAMVTDAEIKAMVGSVYYG